MKGLILAAGLGTRLRPLTESRAKPSLPVVGIPTLWYSVWHLNAKLNVSEVALNFSHAPESVRIAAGDVELSAALGVQFHFSDESSKLMGSSGALWKLRDWVDDSTLAVCNGDSISLPDWRRMLDFHRKNKALITLHLRAFSSNSECYTNIKVRGDGLITELGEKQNSGVMFSGCYLLEPEAISRLPAGFSDFRPSLLEPLKQQRRLYGYREDGAWIDTGTVPTYAAAQFDLMRVLPETRALVELKMIEIEPDIWIPRAWRDAGVTLKLTAPVVMTGNQEDWGRYSKSFGPNFVGVEAPKVNVSGPNSNAVVLSDCLYKL